MTEEDERGTHSPRRWLILGSGGAGKSTFARRLGALLDLPVIHLDRHYWNPGWVETEKDAWAEKGSRVPLSRPGDPSHIAKTVVFLSTNDYMTGDVLFVDGGEHLLAGGGRDNG